MHIKAIDLEGGVFGRLTVLSRIPNEAGKYRMRWNCICACGNYTKTLGELLRSGKSVSCGCFHKERNREISTTHGKSRTKIYFTWRSMLARCENPKNSSYPQYGGRGISVCPEWHRFETFMSDMGSKPAGCSIDRINNAEGYSKQNCRWATAKEQAANRRKKSCGSYTKPFKGISYDKFRNKWRACSQQRKFLGRFETEEEALNAVEKSCTSVDEARAFLERVEG